MGFVLLGSSDRAAATHARHRGQRPSEGWWVELGLVEAALSRASADAACAGEPPSQLYELFFRENIMNRIGLCAIVVAALSVISFPVGALILNSAASGDASSASSSESAGASAPALSPDGKPVRVISLSASVRPGEVPASSNSGGDVSARCRGPRVYRRDKTRRGFGNADRTRNSSGIAGALGTQAQSSGAAEHAVRVGASQEGVRHQRTVLARGQLG